MNTGVDAHSITDDEIRELRNTPGIDDELFLATTIALEISINSDHAASRRLAARRRCAQAYNQLRRPST